MSEHELAKYFMGEPEPVIRERVVSWGGVSVYISKDLDGDVLFEFEKGLVDFILDPGELVGALKALGVINE